MIFKNLTFDGISLKEYGVYISGEAVFDSPARDVEMITIPGRNGSFALDKGRFNNITVTYPAGIYATSETEFAEKVSTLRNLLASRKGYCRLTDEYNPDEFRLGVYKAGLELDPTHYNEAGRFELSFDCKPQRFLFSGEEVFTLGEWGQTETKSGSIASFEGNETTAIKSLTAQIVPKQSGSGDPSPSNVRPISGWDSVIISSSPYGESYPNPITGKNLYEAPNDTVNALVPCHITAGTNFTVSCDGISRPGVRYYNGSKELIDYWSSLASTASDGRKYRTITAVASRGDTEYIEIYGATDGVKDIMVELGTTLSPYEPYGTFKSVSLGQTVYGGTLDVVSGVLTSFPYYSSYNGQTLSGRWICDRAVYSQGTTPPTGSQVVDMSGNGTEVTLTPTEVQTLLGQNNIWADSGDVTVEIGQNPNVLVNPTLFDAHPLISFNASGDGTITIGDKPLHFYNKPLGVIPLPYVVYNYRPTGNYYCLDLVTFDENTPHNTGDAFTFVGAKATLTIQSETEISSVYFATGQALRYIPGGGGVSGNTATITLEDWQESSFVYGTARTVTKSVEWRIVVAGSSTAQTQTITLELIYGGANTVRVRWSATLTSGMTISSGSSSANYVANVDSTANSLTGDLYIDLDIGEAYRIENGSVVSINNFVNLGGELPTLDPGATEISTDDSISNVKVTPRWWKV